MSQIFGEWTVVGDAGRTKDGKKLSLVKCKCGLEKIVQFGNLKAGTSKRCFDCAAKRRGEINTKNADLSGLVNQKCAYGRYRQGATKRGLVFEITFDDFLRIASQNCYYCGQKPSNCYNLKYCKGPNKGKPRAGKAFVHNGIDRVDSKNGYVKHNCVSCCKRCNLAKNDMGETEFHDWIDRVYHHCEERIKTNGQPLSSCCVFGEEVGRCARGLPSNP